VRGGSEWAPEEHVANSGRRWTKAEDTILIENQKCKRAEIVKMLQAAGFPERTQNAISRRYQRLGICRRAMPTPRMGKAKRPLTPTEQTRFDMLEALILGTRARIEAGGLRPENPGSPAMQAVDIVLRGCNANPGILDELVVVTQGLGEAS